VHRQAIVVDLLRMNFAVGNAPSGYIFEYFPVTLCAYSGRLVAATDLIFKE